MTAENPEVARPTFNYESDCIEIYEELRGELRSAYRLDTENAKQALRRSKDLLQEDLQSNRLGKNTLKEALECYQPGTSLEPLPEADESEKLHEFVETLESTAEQMFVYDGIDSSGLGR